ncbi:thiosulfate sulfurtransferase/rhodanese-like domain-containing protein 3 [Diadema setosum]|uniref:thiosulfate sulfurtransferase/rhodanese-like domain-containing protein 3 n=1 Tax=Diadema setosum TaxID=31175 RepID=UPI003B3A74C9
MSLLRNMFSLQGLVSNVTGVARQGALPHLRHARPSFCYAAAAAAANNNSHQWVSTANTSRNLKTALLNSSLELDETSFLRQNLKIFHLDMPKTTLIRCLCSFSGDAHNCHHEELLGLIKSKNITLIDVRREEELQETGMMYGALNIPLDELKQAFELPDDKFEQRYGKPRPKDNGASIVFSCRSGRRSLTAIEIAREKGFSKARHYPGGWIGWHAKSKL